MGNIWRINFNYSYSNKSTVEMNNYQYRCIVRYLYTKSNISSATLTVNALPSVSVQPLDFSNCSGAATFSVTATGTHYHIMADL